MSNYNRKFFFRKEKSMSKGKKGMKYFTAFLLLFLLFFTACGRQDPQKNQKALEDRLKILEERVTVLEKGISKLNSSPAVQSEEGKANNIEKVKNTEKGKEKISEVTKDAKKNKPDFFYFADYKIEIQNFTYRMGEGNTIEYFGDIINKGDKNIDNLSLIIEFFDYEGALIGGHSFPIKIIFAKNKRSFTNSDSIRGGFKNIFRYDIKIKYVGYEGGHLKEREEDKFNE